MKTTPTQFFRGREALDFDLDGFRLSFDIMDEKDVLLYSFDLYIIGCREWQRK
jgi:hypothetical protein